MVATQTIRAKRLVYKSYGDTLKMLQLEDITLSTADLKETQVLVRWLACCIGPLDIAHITGNYALKPSLPAVAGNEGVGVVESVGSGVKELKKGDQVIPQNEGIGGTWCTHGIYETKKLFKLSSAIPTLTAANFLINPVFAYRLLKDYVKLKPGDVVLQNGANSAVGRYVIQLCRIWNFKTVNIVRDRHRPYLAALTKELKELGADEVLTEDEFRKSTRKMKGIRLALDCAAGDLSSIMIAALEPGGVLVTEGGMSGKLMMISPYDLIYKDAQERYRTYAELATWFKQGKLKDPPMVQRQLADYLAAIKASQEPGHAKQVFVFQDAGLAK
ncbi:Protein MECR-1 [Aphelenchoides avenae]|nr:Protein MECR-1 [Aphelenchus avenae]